MRTFFNPENLLADKNQLFPCVMLPTLDGGWEVLSAKMHIMPTLGRRMGVKGPPRAYIK